jgi:hypothetical protein
VPIAATIADVGIAVIDIVVIDIVDTGIATMRDDAIAARHTGIGGTIRVLTTGAVAVA